MRRRIPAAILAELIRLIRPATTGHAALEEEDTCMSCVI